MPSIRYYNQTAPFWDFVAGLEERGASHPFFADQRGEGSDSEGQGPSPWGWGWGGWAGPHRGHHHGPPHHPHHPHHHHGPDGPPGGESSAFPPPPPKEKNGDGADPPESVPDGPPGHPPPGYDGPPPPPHMRGCHGRRGRGGCDPRGRHGFGGFGGWGGNPRMSGGPFALNRLAEFLNSQFLGNDNDNNNDGDGQQQDFKPDADVFDTESSFIVHVSLPGASKEDVGVNWDADKSELSISGVVHRPGDEEFLKTLALNERKIGAFEKKVRLGSRANPAQVDIDMITAKLENGVLQVSVPKLDKDYVEIKKVEVE